MKSRKLALLTVFVSVSGGGCGTPNFPQYNVLGDLRIITIVPDQPEVNPGTTVNFTPVLSDMNGAGRTLNYAIQGCIDPGVGIGASPVCNPPDASSIQSGTVTIPVGTSQTYTGSVPSFALTMPSSSTIFANQSTQNQFNGIAYLIFYTLSVPNTSTSVNSFLRVVVSATTKTPKNQNPTMSSINMNDVATSSVFSMPTAATNFSAISPASASESYQTMNASGSLNASVEQLTDTWFISDGSFVYQWTNSNAENAWTPPSPKPTGRGMVMVVVVRDGRNGVAFQKIEMN